MTLATPSDVDVVLGPDQELICSAQGCLWGSSTSTSRADGDKSLGYSRQGETDYVAEALVRQLAIGLATEDQVAAPCRPAALDRANLQLIRKIGEGAFGEVWQGKLLSQSAGSSAPAATVAVKTLKASVVDEAAFQSAARELLDEATLMAQIGKHPNLVELIGVIDDTSGAPLVTLEFCNGGSLRALLKFLPDPRSGASDPAEADRLLAGMHIARGMAFLGKHHSAVHRDLAARNVLVEDGVERSLTCLFVGSSLCLNRARLLS